MTTHDDALPALLTDDEVRAMFLRAWGKHTPMEAAHKAFAHMVEQRVRAALAAREGEAVGDMVLVPREPDQAWWDAVWKSVYADGYARGSASVVQVKRLLDVLHAAMIAAAPPAPSQDEVTIWFDGGRLLVRIDESPWTEWLEPALVSIAGGAELLRAVSAALAPPLAVTTAPERIWLQVGGDLSEPFPDHFINEVTWCAESVESAEVEYVRADLAAAPSHEAMRAALEALERYEEAIAGNEQVTEYQRSVMYGSRAIALLRAALGE